MSRCEGFGKCQKISHLCREKGTAQAVSVILIWECFYCPRKRIKTTQATKGLQERDNVFRNYQWLDISRRWPKVVKCCHADMPFTHRTTAHPELNSSDHCFALGRNPILDTFFTLTQSLRMLIKVDFPAKLENPATPNFFPTYLPIFICLFISNHSPLPTFRSSRFAFLLTFFHSFFIAFFFPLFTHLTSLFSLLSSILSSLVLTE